MFEKVTKVRKKKIKGKENPQINHYQKERRKPQNQPTLQQTEPNPNKYNKRSLSIVILYPDTPAQSMLFSTLFRLEGHFWLNHPPQHQTTSLFFCCIRPQPPLPLHRFHPSQFTSSLTLLQPPQARKQPLAGRILPLNFEACNIAPTTCWHCESLAP